MRVVVFSNSSFGNASIRLGLQIMASQLAERGHDVDYLPAPTHPLELPAPMRRSNCIHAWFKRGDKIPVSVSERLREYSFRAPFSRWRRCCWFEHQARVYSMFAPSWMKSRRYDACIRDTAMSGLFADQVRASVRVLRLNDNPGGLLDDVHPPGGEAIEAPDQRTSLRRRLAGIRDDAEHHRGHRYLDTGGEDTQRSVPRALWYGARAD